MAPVLAYQGIKYPDRAERISDFEAYRVFLDHWDKLSLALGEKFEGVALRGESRVLAVHGEQGRGKTLFAQQLYKDFERTKKGDNSEFNPNNLWHRVAGGLERSVDLVINATDAAECIHIEDKSDWANELSQRLRGNRDRNYIVIADNSERAYFRQGLVAVNDVEFLRLQSNPDFATMIAQRLVHKCRTTMARCLFLLLSNDQEYLCQLEKAVERQHQGLLEGVMYFY